MLRSYYCKNPWIMLLPLIGYILYDFVQLNILNVISLQTMQLIGISAWRFGVFSSLYFYINLILLFVAGILLECFPVKKIMLTAITISLLGFAFFIIKPTIISLIIWRLTAGVAGAFSITSSIKFISDWFPSNKIGVLIGFIGAIATFGGLLAQMPLAFSITRFGYFHTLIGISIFGLVVIGCMLMMLQSKNERIVGTNISLIAKMYSAFANLRNWNAALFECLMNLPLFVLGALWGNAYLVKAHSLHNSNAAIIVSMLFVGHMLGAPAFGYLTDKLLSRKLLMLVGILLAAVCIWCVDTNHLLSNNILMLLFFSLGFSTGVQCVTDAYVVSNSKQHVGLSIGLLYSVSIAGGAIFQPAFGWFIQNSKTVSLGYTHGMQLLLIATLFAFVSFFFIPNKQKAAI